MMSKAVKAFLPRLSGLSLLRLLLGADNYDLVDGAIRDRDAEAILDCLLYVHYSCCQKEEYVEGKLKAMIFGALVACIGYEKYLEDAS